MDNAPPQATAHVYAMASEWEDLKETVREARGYALEARDSSRENSQQLAQVVVPKLKLVDLHQDSIQQTRGALWAFGVIGAVLALGLAALPFLVR